MAILTYRDFSTIPTWICRLFRSSLRIGEIGRQPWKPWEDPSFGRSLSASSTVATPLNLKQPSLAHWGIWNEGLPAQRLSEQGPHIRRAAGNEIAPGLPTVDTAADDGAKVDAIKYALSLHFHSLITVRLQVVYLL